jgi:hypothetical protein
MMLELEQLSFQIKLKILVTFSYSSWHIFDGIHLPKEQINEKIPQKLYTSQILKKKKFQFEFLILYIFNIQYIF